MSMESSEGLTEKRSNLDSVKDGGEIPTSFQYTPKEGTGYFAAAKFIIENSGDLRLVQQVKKNPYLISEVAKAIQMSFEKQGIALQAGKTYTLSDAGSYVPRLATKGEISTSFKYIPEAGTGYFAAARFIIENSSDSRLIQQSKINPNVVSEVAQAIKMRFEKQGITLQAGKTYILSDVGAYVPRLTKKSSESDSLKSKTNNDKTITTDHTIIQKLLSSDRFGSERTKDKIKAIVVHQTGGHTAKDAIDTFKKNSSIHYLIDKDGSIYQLVPDLYVANHVGPPKKSNTLIFSYNSIGIEFVGFYDKVPGKRDPVYRDLTPEQQDSGKWLLKQLMMKYNIASDHIYRHPQLAPKNETEAQSVEIPK
jgi:hypothetical protein